MERRRVSPGTSRVPPRRRPSWWSAAARGRTCLAAGISIAAIAGVTWGVSSARQVAFGQGATVTIPAFDHIVTVVMENHDYSEIIGNPSAPYINSLAAAGALATSYQAVNHPSEPNYLALTSGNDFASNSCVTGDGDPAGACVVRATNIGDRLEAAGKTWKGYMESMPSPCYLTDSGEYGVRHDPFPYYQDIQGSPARCRAHVVPYTKLATDFAAASTTPNYAFITPNVCNDMHDCSVATGDAWLKANLPTILTSPAWTTQKSLLMIVWDECGTCADPGNKVAMVMLGSPGSGVRAGGFRSATPYTHYSLLKTIESSWGLAPMTTKDSAASPMSDFFTTSPTSSPTPTMTVHGLRLVTGVHLPPTRLPHLTPAATVYSNNWSGYATLPKTGTSTRFRFVAADFNIPSVVCGPLGSSGNSVYSSWVGLDGYNDSTVEQTGVIADCATTGGPTYYAFFEMVPLAPVVFTGVSPGDAIKVSAYFNHVLGKYSLALTDVTTGGFVHTTQPCPPGSVCRNTSAEVISEATGGGPPKVDLPDFGMESYTAAAVTSTSGIKGTLTANAAWASSEIIMKDASNSHIMATPSSLFGGAAFNVLWQAAA